MFSLQTNVDSLVARPPLNLANDAVGLDFANGLRSTIAGFVDAGPNNRSNIFNRLKTLATESAASTFTGSRSTLSDEYANLGSEVTRQATKINLQSGGTFNQEVNFFFEGGSDTGHSSVSVDHSGAENAADATSLGRSTNNVLNRGVAFGVPAGSTNTLRLDPPNALFLAPAACASSAFNLPGATDVTAKVIATYGISARLNLTGKRFSGASAFSVTNAATNPLLVSASAKSGDDTNNCIVHEINVYTARTTATEYGLHAIGKTAKPAFEFQSDNRFSVDSNQDGQNLPTATGIRAIATASNYGTTKHCHQSRRQTSCLFAPSVWRSRKLGNLGCRESNQDATVAIQAANLTKSQLLTQTALRLARKSTPNVGRRSKKGRAGATCPDFLSIRLELFVFRCDMLSVGQ